MTDIKVLHLGTSIMHTGTEAECKAHRDAQPFDASNWKISDIESYGDACYSEGYDSGFDSGAQNGF